MKIIVSNKAISHMKAHENEFLVDWKKLIKICEKHKKIKGLAKEFEIVELEFERPVGYCKLVEVKENEKVVYGRRVGRDNYSKFIKDVNPTITNKLTLILKKSYQKPDEYYLITMFPGEKSYKEPEDINIADKKELEESLRFWSRHALIYDKDIVIEDSVRGYCPYKNLYLAIS